MPSPAHCISRFSSLVFDVDGTLVNSKGDITAAMSQTLEGMGFAPLTPDYVMPNLHSTADRILIDVFQDLGYSQPDDLQAVRAQFYKNYMDYGHASSVLYPGVREFLGLCADRGQKLAICTNKREGMARDVLARLGVLEYFQAITGCDT